MRASRARAGIVKLRFFPSSSAAHVASFPGLELLSAAVLSITLAPALRDALLRGKIRSEKNHPVSRAIMASRHGMDCFGERRYEGTVYWDLRILGIQIFHRCPTRNTKINPRTILNDNRSILAPSHSPSADYANDIIRMALLADHGPAP